MGAGEVPDGRLVDRLLEGRQHAARIAGTGEVRQRAPGHVQVTDLAGRTRRTAMQPSTEDDRDADAAADPDQGEVGHAAGGTDPRLGDGGQVDVVLERDRPVEVGVERISKSVVPAGQVEGEGDVAGGRIDHAGGTEHDSAHPVPGRVGLFRPPP